MKTMAHCYNVTYLLYAKYLGGNGLLQKVET